MGPEEPTGNGVLQTRQSTSSSASTKLGELRFEPGMDNPSVNALPPRESSFKATTGRRRSKSQGHLLPPSHAFDTEEYSPLVLAFEEEAALSSFDFGQNQTHSHSLSQGQFQQQQEQQPQHRMEHAKSQNLDGLDLSHGLDGLASIHDYEPITGGRKWASSFHAFERDNLLDPSAPNLDGLDSLDSLDNALPLGGGRLQSHRPSALRMANSVQRDRAESDISPYFSASGLKSPLQMERATSPTLQRHRNNISPTPITNINNMNNRNNSISSMNNQVHNPSGMNSVNHYKSRQQSQQPPNQHQQNQRSPGGRSHSNGNSEASRAAAGTNKGDWLCIQCGNTNYSWRHVCNMRRCRAPKPGHLSMEPTPPGSWACMACGNLNYAERMVCNMRKCRAPRPVNQQQMFNNANMNQMHTMGVRGMNTMGALGGLGTMNGLGGLSNINAGNMGIGMMDVNRISSTLGMNGLNGLNNMPGMNSMTMGNMNTMNGMGMMKMNSGYASGNTSPVMRNPMGMNSNSNSSGNNASSRGSLSPKMQYMNFVNDSTYAGNQVQQMYPADGVTRNGDGRLSPGLGLGGSNAVQDLSDQFQSGLRLRPTDNDVAA